MQYITGHSIYIHILNIASKFSQIQLDISAHDIEMKFRKFIRVEEEKRRIALRDCKQHGNSTGEQTSYLWTYDLYGPVSNAFYAGKYITRASGRGWALEMETFLGPVKWHPAGRGVPFGAKKIWIYGAQPPPTGPCNGFGRSKGITYRAVSIRVPQVVLCI